MNNNIRATGIIVIMILGALGLGLPEVFASNTWNVKDYGAVMDGTHDDTAAVLQTFSNAASGDVIYFPVGTAVMHSPILVSNESLVICGENVSGSCIRWIAPGGININIPISQQCEVLRLTLIAGCANAGVALRLVSTNRATRALVAQDLDIIGTAGGCWNESIYLTSATLSILKNIAFNGNYPNTTNHVHIDGLSNAVQMSNLNGCNSQYGVFWQGTGQGPYLHNSSFANNDYGVVYYDTNNDAIFYDVMFCAITSRVDCVWYYNGRNTSLANNQFVLTGNTGSDCVRLQGNLTIDFGLLNNVMNNLGSAANTGIHATDATLVTSVSNTLSGFTVGCNLDGASSQILIGDSFTNVATPVQCGPNVTNIYRRQ